MKRSELKALVKECLVEILADGLGPALVEHAVKSSTARRSEAPVNRVPASIPRSPSTTPVTKVPVPDFVPNGMRSLFEDSARRIAEQDMTEVVQREKQGQVLGAMASSAGWDKLAFVGSSGAPPPRSPAQSTDVMGDFLKDLTSESHEG